VLPAFRNSLSADYAQASFTVDTTQANQLLQRAGFTRGSDGIDVDKNGKKLSFSMNVVNGFTNWVNDCQIMAGELKEIGLSVSINPISFGAWYSALQLGNYDTAVAWSTPGPSPFFILDGLLNSTNTAPPGKIAPSNWERWSSPTSYSLLNQYASTTDSNVQRQAIDGLEKIMVEQVPAIALLNGAIYSEYSTAHFTGWPSSSDPYALAHPVDSPDNEITLLHLQPVS
jgi:peptide/nickel transport system substrate-binding protein